MTSFSLLLWIAFGIALQVAIWLGIEFRRQLLEYQGQRGGVPTQGDSPLPAEPFSGPVSDPVPVAAWTGLRSLRVERKGLSAAT